jgi:hypothetical protein
VLAEGRLRTGAALLVCLGFGFRRGLAGAAAAVAAAAGQRCDGFCITLSSSSEAVSEDEAEGTLWLGPPLTLSKPTDKVRIACRERGWARTELVTSGRWMGLDEEVRVE